MTKTPEQVRDLIAYNRTHGKIVVLPMEEAFAAKMNAVRKAWQAKQHTHTVEHAPQDGTGVGVCACGASVDVRNGQVAGRWHACALCSTEVK